MIQQAIEKASVLIEALPYIQRFREDLVVVKVGGSIMDDEQGLQNILKDLAFMECVGLRPVLVHGGGKSISAAMTSQGLKPHFLNGMRVTDADTIRVVEQVLNHEVNTHLCDILSGFETKAVPVHGQDIIRCQRHTETDEETGDVLDWGFVGDITSVDVSSLRTAVSENAVPVITPLGSDADGQVYNINADVAAAAVARHLKARKLVFLTDVPGLMHDPEDKETLISTLKQAEVDRLIERGIIAGGMLPKVRSAIDAIQAGVKKTHIIDAAMPHSLLLELFTDKGIGTEIVA